MFLFFWGVFICFITKQKRNFSSYIIGVRFANDDADEDDVKPKLKMNEDIVIPSKRRDFVLIQFISDDSKNVDVAFRSIKAQVTKETRHKTIELKKDGHYDDLELVIADKAKHKVNIYNIMIIKVYLCIRNLLLYHMYATDFHLFE
jgi:hypothetical protein